MKNSLLNPNQLRHFGLELNDNPYSNTDFGIHTTSHFIPFSVTGTIVYFRSRVPTEWEENHLPVILLTDKIWDPQTVQMGNVVQSAAAVRRGRTNVAAANLHIELIRDAPAVLAAISSAFDEREFCSGLERSVRIATLETKNQVGINGVLSSDRHSAITAEELSRKWNIGLKTAEATMKCTTQRGIRTATRPLSRRLRVDHLNLHRKRLSGVWYCDTLLARVKSLLGNSVANVFTNGKYTKVIPLEARRHAGDSLVRFCDDVGVPEMLITDGAAEFTSGQKEFGRHARRMRIRLHVTEQGRSNQNHAAEREIGYLSRRWKMEMSRKSVPKQLWDFGLVYQAEIISRMARGDNGRSGYEEVTGETPEIGEWLDFGFYDLVWWWD